MKLIYPTLALFILLQLSCSNTEQSNDIGVKTKKTTFPYQLDSIPEEWIIHTTEWYNFHLPPDWRLVKNPTLDTSMWEIISADTTTVIAFDDLNYGIQPATLMNTGWPNDIADIDTLIGVGELYYNLENRLAELILYDSYWISTNKSLTADQFEVACKILQTIRLRSRRFSDDYFKSYRNGQLFKEPDPFKNQVEDATTALFSAWGFSLEEQTTLDKLSDYEQHWWLKIFHQHHHEDTSLYPKAKDWQAIKAIRQFAFKKNAQVVIEEWQLENVQAARSWLDIVERTIQLDEHKPPRFYWIDGSKMYFIMADTAEDWFAYSNQMIEFFSGKEQKLLSFFNQPLDLKAYKKANGAHSGGRNVTPYLIKPDTIGTYFNYFYFRKLRDRYPTKQSFRGLVIGTYIYGEEIGYYEQVVEELISVKSRLEDRDLKKLNFVGKHKKDVVDLLGTDYLTSNELMIYQHHGDLLILQLEDDKILWFNYIRTKLHLESSDDLPKELQYFAESIPN
jgi:hypothetical protein